MSYGWHDFVGNIGVVLILLAYLGVTLERLSAREALFSILNAAGALLILVSLYFNFNLSSAIIECAWLLISLFGLSRVLLHK